MFDDLASACGLQDQHGRVFLEFSADRVVKSVKVDACVTLLEASNLGDLIQITLGFLVSTDKRRSFVLKHISVLVKGYRSHFACVSENKTQAVNDQSEHDLPPVDLSVLAF